MLSCLYHLFKWQIVLSISPILCMLHGVFGPTMCLAQPFLARLHTSGKIVTCLQARQIPAWPGNGQWRPRRTVKLSWILGSWHAVTPALSWSPSKTSFTCNPTWEGVSVCGSVINKINVIFNRVNQWCHILNSDLERSRVDLFHNIRTQILRCESESQTNLPN